MKKIQMAEAVELWGTDTDGELAVIGAIFDGLEELSHTLKAHLFSHGQYEEFIPVFQPGPTSPDAQGVAEIVPDSEEKLCSVCGMNLFDQEFPYWHHLPDSPECKKIAELEAELAIQTLLAEQACKKIAKLERQIVDDLPEFLREVSGLGCRAIRLLNLMERCERGEDDKKEESEDGLSGQSKASCHRRTTHV